MNIFEFRNSLTRYYAEYVRSFIRISSEDIRAKVDDALERQHLWPEPLVQMNPAFEPGAYVDDLVQAGSLHALNAKVFRRDKDRDPTELGERLRLHKHQVEALEVARGGHNYVVTTGTGSGKSLTYIIPIVDHVLRHGSGHGITAIVVYPMNALANSQAGELEKFLNYGLGEASPVTFKRYTGQDDDATRNAIIANPPDILLTNYVMLELILTRSKERELITAASGLRFLVFDELHTYRGRQGADVAMLIRRTRNRMQSPELQCIGTSATMSSQGDAGSQQAEVARVATKVFGALVEPGHVIGETLRRITPEVAPNATLLAERVNDIDALTAEPYETFVTDPLASWVESMVGVELDATSNRLVRAKPRRLTGQGSLAESLAELTGLSIARCADALQRLLLAAYDKRSAESDQPAFAFRLHQFISRGDAAFASLEAPGQRYVTLRAQKLVPGQPEKVLEPVAFCRECGHEYYTVWKATDQVTGVVKYTQRRLSDMRAEGEAEPGFLYTNPAHPWPAPSSGWTSSVSREEADLLPDDWVEEHNGDLRVVSSRRDDMPTTVTVATDGTESSQGETFQYISAPFRFCLACGVHYPGKRNDFAKLSVLSTGGRATATTVLSLSAVRQLQESDLPPRARKLLSFTDNRQDASLQAGHFNDFVDVGMLRGALYRAALHAGEAGLGFDDVRKAVFDALDLDFAEYANEPDALYGARASTEAALRELLAYRVFQDLKRGWRITAPNLEQVGLLEIRYAFLDEACADENLWAGTHLALACATPEVRRHVVRTLLDYMRRQLAVNSELLDPEAQEGMRTRSRQFLNAEWRLDEGERLERAYILFPRSKSKTDTGEHVFLSSRSRFGQFLRRGLTFPGLNEKLGLEATEQIILDLLDRLRRAGLVERTHPPRNEGDVPGYRLAASALRWHAGDGSHPPPDPLTTVRRTMEAETNEFFKHFYMETARHLTGLEAHEHTAQVSVELRQQREDAFREGKLPVLYCSPTMELGVDIAGLNVVNLRNVPPTPANYAQRSGRAGRSGQPALVFTYCSNGSSHDQYFFTRQEQMVHGVVEPPRLDLTNEDLVRAHVHSIWLAETHVDLGRSLREVLDLQSLQLPLLTSVRDGLSESGPLKRAATRAADVLEQDRDLLSTSSWYHETWIADTLRNALESFDRACNRWRELYRSALAQADAQDKVIRDATKGKYEKNRARSLRNEAESQLNLLADTDKPVQSDFYSYRYFASEGFLPGYSFPRLPLAAFIPGRRLASGRDEFVQRPRFLAIAEFGPRAIVYHEGAKYRVTKVNLSPTQQDEDPGNGRAKLCDHCGYLHPIQVDPAPDRCENCGAELPAAFTSLLRLQNVSTRREERINSDEEERQRLGYDVITAIRFAQGEHQPAVRSGEVLSANGDSLASLTVAHAATLWRINLGWKHREVKNQHGFVLDLQNGTWASDKALQDDDGDSGDTVDGFGRHKLVVPFVEDTRNALLWRPSMKLDEGQFHSLREALKNAIQVEYQLEDNELGAEVLPTQLQSEPTSILLYEAAEGGAGVLRQLLDDANAIPRVARRALEICHFDPDTGLDLGHAPHATERCESACYDCLMSYGNQRSHTILDRFAIRGQLLHLANARVEASPTPLSRAEHLRRLTNLCQSGLERDFLALLKDRNLRLPSSAQELVEAASTRPDFLYTTNGRRVAVYIDGPHHDYPNRQMRDCEKDQAMDDLGYTVLRFHHQDDWPTKLAEFAWLFGATT